MSETASGMQNCLNALNDYCEKWHLSVNAEKTNIKIVQKKKTSINGINFHLGNHSLKGCDKYKYLGCIINKNGNFKATRTDLCQKATKVLFKLQKIVFFLFTSSAFIQQTI